MVHFYAAAAVHFCSAVDSRAALIAEKRLHGELRSQYPEAVVPPEEFADYLQVISEIYDISLEPTILEMLDRVEATARQPG